MAYQNNIPQPTDQLSKSQSDILNNFAEIKTLVDVNHVTFGSPDQGKHKFITMPVQGSSPATLGGEVALFSRTSTLSSLDEIAWRRSTNGVVIEFTSALNTNNGWTRFPSGILVKWGFVTVPVATQQTVTFPVAATIPVFTNVFNIQLTPVVGFGNSPATINLISGTFNTLTFDIYTANFTNTSNVAFYYYVTGN